MQFMLVDKNIEDDVPFKGEGIVTPWKRSMNVNNILNLLQDC